MVNVDIDWFISIFRVLLMREQTITLFLFFYLDEFPDIILRIMVGCVWTTWYFIVDFAVWMFDLVSMKIVLCFEVAKNDWLAEKMRFAITVNFMKRFAQMLHLFFFQLYQRTDHDLSSSFVGKRRNSVVEVITEWCICIGGERWLIDAFFLVDDGCCFVMSVSFVPGFSGLLVGLPLLLLWVANAHLS